MHTEKQSYDVVVVGGGMAGLTSACYCARSGLSVLLCEQQDGVGGLVNSFKRDGFSFDGGIRAIENSGIILPMLKQLGIELTWIQNPVSLQVGTERMVVDKTTGFSNYQALLVSQFPGEQQAIEAIVKEMETMTKAMHYLYGIDNPLFLESYNDMGYLRKTLLPWLLESRKTFSLIHRLKEPVAVYLRRFTANGQLIDVIAQHFIADTPAFFALSYFGLYLEYQYPLGGIQAMPDAMLSYLTAHKATVLLNTKVESVNATRQTINESISYSHLIWAADLKSLYRFISIEGNVLLQRRVQRRKKGLEERFGGDSIFSLFVATDLPPSYFSERTSAHMFFTPKTDGMSSIGTIPLEENRDAIEAYLKAYTSVTTYEISLPVLRDETLAPKGCSALILSMLSSYALFERILQQGWYEEAKTLCEEEMMKVVGQSLFPQLLDHVLFCFSATPCSLQERTGNSEGAITGWAFGKDAEMVTHSMRKIAGSVKSGIAHVSQAGQWVFSPSGLPISVLTGKLAAQKALKDIGKKQNLHR